MDWSQAQKELEKRLAPGHGDREAAIIADWIMERVTGQSKLERLLRKTEELRHDALTAYERWSRELLAGRPVQYVLGQSWFAVMKFFVDERVLIPRPETEELVEWMISEAAPARLAPSGQPAPQSTPADQVPAPASILDVGTGSGCIAITLSRRLPGMAVYACDVSE